MVILRAHLPAGCAGARGAAAGGVRPDDDPGQQEGQRLRQLGGRLLRGPRRQPHARPALGPHLHARHPPQDARADEACSAGPAWSCAHVMLSEPPCYCLEMSSWYLDLPPSEGGQQHSDAVNDDLCSTALCRNANSRRRPSAWQPSRTQYQTQLCHAASRSYTELMPRWIPATQMRNMSFTPAQEEALLR